MSNFKKLSVVILCYKSEEKIIPFVEIIENVMQNMHSDYELVLVANYTLDKDDKTPEIVKNLSKKK